MEYCAGGDLFSYIEKRGFRLAEARAAQIIHKLCTAIFYLHSYGITHRDLKPENIMMTDNSEAADIKLLDFGLSKIIGPNEYCNEPFGTLVKTYIMLSVTNIGIYCDKLSLFFADLFLYFEFNSIIKLHK